RRPRLVVGFAAETEHVVENATAKRKKKGCDWIVANDVSPQTGTFGGDNNTVHVIDARGAETWPRLSKDDVAGPPAQRTPDQLAPAGLQPTPSRSGSRPSRPPPGSPCRPMRPPRPPGSTFWPRSPRTP